MYHSSWPLGLYVATRPCLCVLGCTTDISVWLETITVLLLLGHYSAKDIGVGLLYTHCTFCTVLASLINCNLFWHGCPLNRSLHSDGLVNPLDVVNRLWCVPFKLTTLIVRGNVAVPFWVGFSIAVVHACIWKAVALFTFVHPLQTPSLNLFILMTSPFSSSKTNPSLPVNLLVSSSHYSIRTTPLGFSPIHLHNVWLNYNSKTSSRLAAPTSVPHVTPDFSLSWYGNHASNCMSFMIRSLLLLKSGRVKGWKV